MSVTPFRPANETQQNLDDESRAIKIIEREFKCDGIKMSKFLYRVDWAFFRGQDLVAFGEYKKRSVRYPTLLISVAKVIDGRRLASEAGVPFILFVEWPDGLHYLKFTNEKFKAVRGGNSRGQNGDIEPVYLIPSELFVKMKCVEVEVKNVQSNQ